MTEDILQRPVAAFRGLIVDDDSGVRDYLSTLLGRRCIVTETAENGDEAAHRLRTQDFDVVFLDLRLPQLSGEFILKLIDRGTLKRPGAIALMSTPQNLAEITGSAWTAGSTLLPKPFASTEVEAFLDRSLRTPEAEWVPPAQGIVVGGSGLWADSLVRVMSRRGGWCEHAITMETLVEVVRQVRPGVAVMGPPFTHSELVQMTSQIRSSAHGHETTIIAAIPHDDPAFSADLLTIGVDRIVPVGRGVSALSDDLMRVAGLPRRSHRRVPLQAPVMLRGTKTGLRLGNAFDLCEGGIGIDSAPSFTPVRGNFDLEFMLAGEVIEAGSEVAWKSDERIGLRFTSVAAQGLGRIRQYVSAHGSMG